MRIFAKHVSVVRKLKFLLQWKLTRLKLLFVTSVWLTNLLIISASFDIFDYFFYVSLKSIIWVIYTYIVYIGPQSLVKCYQDMNSECHNNLPFFISNVLKFIIFYPRALAKCPKRYFAHCVYACIQTYHDNTFPVGLFIPLFYKFHSFTDWIFLNFSQ